MIKRPTKKAVKPSPSALLKRVRTLQKNLKSLANTHPPPKNNRAICPIEYPLQSAWRPDPGKTGLESYIKDTLKWTREFDEYLRHLETYFVHWEDRPDKFDRFPLAKCVRGYWSSQNMPRESILKCLEQHEELLLIERSKTESSELRKQLRSAITKANFSDETAAKEMDLDRGTVEDFLNGKTSNLRAQSREKMKHFIDERSKPATSGSSVS